MHYRTIFCLKKIVILLMFSIATIPASQVDGLPSLSQIMSAITDNFHVVEKYQLYRCNQVSAKKLKWYIYRYEIQTVVNLRGINDAGWWYAEEQATRDMEVQYYNIAMSAKRLPLKEEIEKLLYIFDYAPKPILVHCYSGADRTGLACALWFLSKPEYYDNPDQYKKLAEIQLNPIYYRHIKYKYPLVDQFVDMWAGREQFYESYGIA